MTLPTSTQRDVSESRIAPHHAAPQGIPLPRRRVTTRILLPLFIAAATLTLLLIAARDSLLPAPELEVTPVVLRPIGGGVESGPDSGPDSGANSGAGAVRSPAMSASVQAAGWIEPMPATIAVSALIDGVADEILVVEGDAVAADQVIARLEPSEATIALALAAAGLERAEADLAGASAERDRAARALAHPLKTERALRSATAALAHAELSASTIAAAMAEHRAQIGDAEDDLARKRAIQSSGGVSDQELSRLERRITALRSTGDSLSQQQTASATLVRELTLDVDAARSALDLLIVERGALASSEAALAASRASLRAARAAHAEAELRLARTSIRAPVSGVVLERFASPGSTVSSRGESSVIVSMYQPESLQVRADVPNADIALVTIGARAIVTTEALPGTRIPGQVVGIAGGSNRQKNTVSVQIALDAPPRVLRPDMLCRVTLGEDGTAERAARQILFAPRSHLAAPGTAERATWTALVVGPLRGGVGVVEERSVTTGARRDPGGVDWLEVTAGLRPGDLLLKPGSARPGDRVRPANAGAGGSHEHN